ncbi:MAG: Gfo/Idh/MocA family protein [Pirellulales bacterium]
MNEGAQSSRRQFFRSTASGALAIAASGIASRAWASSESVGDTLRLGFIGVGNRGTTLMQGFLARPDCRVVAICDANRQRLSQVRDIAVSAAGATPSTTTDMEAILSDDKIDAVVIATPDHWHSLAAIYACQAGKHVYVEKPVCNKIWEGQKAVQAARKYDRVVQSGMQSRSAPYSTTAREYIRSGKLGDIILCRVYNQKPEEPAIEAAEDTAPPDYLEWDRWSGPCTNTAFNAARFGHWAAFWDYGGGEVANDGVHQIDLACMALDITELPKSVYSSGQKRAGSIAEVPDTLVTTFEFANKPFPMVFQQTLRGDYMVKADDGIRNGDIFPYWPQNGERIEIFGTKGMMLLGRHGSGFQVFVRPQNRQPVIAFQEKGRFPDKEHKEDFVSAIREGRKPNSDIEHGYRSAALCHLANTSFRVGNEYLKIDPSDGKILNNDAAQELARGDYRKPYAVPDDV